ncbi:ABC-type Fe3+-siderophore transport system inner membrane subunit [Thermobifida fusca YX]|uniref:ABC-type Fe3+-siderophore transport system inner membrane subunit n=2 Tax=Thermobifida fusca TaxID=2021 RepID=Q47T41_THEFY|nr:ABC-type Fe3+-siderophore transport system inner membrane subunit [Thermobifida fusca YX]
MSREQLATVVRDHVDLDDASTARAALVRHMSARATTHALRAGGLAAALGVLVLAALLSLAVGAKPIPLSVVWDALWHFDGSYDHTVILGLRGPRTVLGVTVGAALGLAGALMQVLVRNPIADPGLLGVNMGATTAVVAAIYLFGLTGIDAYVWFSFAGAALTALLVYFLGTRGRTSATPVRLALAGTAVSAVLLGLTNGVILFHDFVFQEIRFWQVGSLAGRDLAIFGTVAPFLAVGALIALALGWSLNALALGEDLAAALGARIGRIRLWTAIAIVLLCGAATAATGPIAFVGLAVPHAARLLTGPDQRWLLPFSAVFGAILLVLSDTLGRVVLPNGELEVGIITALVGAPVFIVLVRRARLVQP